MRRAKIHSITFDFYFRYQSIRRTINQPRSEQETSAESTSSGQSPCRNIN